MKPDREIVRNLMLEMEDSDEPRGKDFPSRFEIYSEVSRHIAIVGASREANPELRDRDYNLGLMKDADLIVLDKPFKNNEFRGGYVRLSNAGHDALDAIRDDTTWSKIKSATPKEAYSLVKGLTSSVGASALAKILGIDSIP